MIQLSRCGAWQRTFPGTPASVGEARRWLAELLEGLPAADAILVLSELASNTLRHTASRERGFAVAVEVRLRTVRLEVTDHGGPAAPALVEADIDDETGRGLHIVEALTTRWGVNGERNGARCVWAELPHKPE
ncbi:MAG: ATP-binding protein [Streptomycetales bacterium]